MMNTDTFHHVRGESLFLDDLPEPAGLLHVAVVYSKLAHAKILSCDTSAAQLMPGVAAVLTAKDIPGANQVGTIVQDEPLLAEGEVHYLGQPVALVVAEDAEIARRAADKVLVELEAMEVVIDPRVAATKGSFVAPSRTIACGETSSAWDTCTHIIEGQAENGGQEHLYLESQAAMVLADERNRFTVYSSTQSPTAVQKGVAGVLDLPMHLVEVEVRRLGGAFGGKEDQATPWAAMTALAAYHTKRPAKLVLRRHEDVRSTGKRHPYSTDYKLGLDAEGRILAFEAEFFQNSGAAADLSTAIMERTLLHAGNCYRLPNARVTVHCCRTNLPPNTAFRGFGGPQAMFVIEAALDHAAKELGLSTLELQKRNLLQEGELFHYGQKAEHCRAKACVDMVLEQSGYDELRQSVAAFNQNSRRHKRGLAMMPVCFGISFTNTALNQAGALVHIYNDGSVSLNSAAIEMGQGVNVKLRRIAARTLGIDLDLVQVDPTHTRRVANTSPTAASTATDLNGMAIMMACRSLRERLLRVASEILDQPVEGLELRDCLIHVNDKASELGWQELVHRAYWSRTDLTAHAYYATPGIHYDKEREQGSPFAYHVYGAAVIQATVDSLLGTAELDEIWITHDGGKLLDPLVDVGQIEGALAQGLGWMTMEELRYTPEGRLLNDSLTTYKVPDLHAIPERIHVGFLPDSDNEHAVFHTKGFGEPPLMYGIGAWFAIADALRAARPDQGISYHAPMTNERMHRFLHD